MATTSFLNDTKLTKKEGQELAKIFKEDKKIVKIKAYSSKKKELSNFLKKNSK
ncbi:hypothetical protein [Haloplasma contractile]|uniref:Uncharacterized protein n=1 Tax=Haloplasma contractile SSD-17B TaxID=1033810 RepID=F7PTT6_9MOLU|nr:hypothetical protein [Haloplasma contractile]ERJ12249.1 hypothetical protein HLPCO_001776 [Haloplasma contractile SSD-17B]